MEDAKVTNLRDERLHRSGWAIGIGGVMRGPLLKGLLLGVVVGALLLTAVLEISLLVADKGELFALVFGGGGN